MAFEEVEIVEASASNATGISAGLAKVRASKAKLRLTIKAHVFDALGLKVEDRFVLLLGKDDDHGVIRLQKNKAGKIRATERNFSGGLRGYMIDLRHRPEFVDRTEKARPCNFEKVDLATFEVVLPPWADETAPGRNKRIAAVPPDVAAARQDAQRLERERRIADERRRERDNLALRHEVQRAVVEALQDVPEIFGDFTPGEKAILSVLAKKPGKVVTRAAMMLLVYPDADNAPDDKIIDVRLTRIRKSLPASVEIITVRGEGYKMIGEVNDLFSSPPVAPSSNQFHNLIEGDA